MKKLIMYLVFIVLSFFVWYQCDDEPAETIIPTPTPSGPQNVCTAAYGEYDGVFCFMFQKLWDMCLFEDSDLTESDVGTIAVDLNSFWELLETEMAKESFSKTAIMDAFETTIFSDTNMEILKLAMVGILSNQDMSSPTNSPTCEEYKHYAHYITDIGECSCPCSGSIWTSVSEYADLMGVNSDDACQVLSTAFGTLNDEFNLASDNVSPADSIFESLDDDCVFNADNANSTDNIETFATYITSDGDSITDWEVLLDNMMENEVQTFLNIFIDMLKGIHDSSSNLELVIALIPTIPGIISGFISQDLSMCEE